MAVIALGVLFYFLPSLIAATRDARYGGQMFLLNLVFGWTILGWLAVLIWAAVEKRDELPKPSTNFERLFATAKKPKNQWHFENDSWKKVD
jgi:hypothetical protein